MKKLLLTIACLLLLWPQEAKSQPLQITSGYFVENDCDGINNRAPGVVMCIQLQNSSGRTPGEYRWDGTSWQRSDGFYVGTVAPTTCKVSEIFFKTDATPGENIYGCTAEPGTWTLQAGGVGTGGHVFHNEGGAALPQRTDADCVGGGITCGDVAGKTEINVPGVIFHEEGGAALTQRTDVNCVGAGITCADVGGQTQISVAAGAESDPIVGAITGVVKADGAGNISAATPDTDFARADPDTKALADNVTAGFWAITAARTLTAGTGIGITNPTGAAGNPTFSLTTAYDCIGSSATTQVLFNNAGNCDGVVDFVYDPTTKVLTTTGGFSGLLSGNVNQSTGISNFAATLQIPGKGVPGSPLVREVYITNEDLRWRGNSGTPANQRAFKDTDFAGATGVMYKVDTTPTYSILAPVVGGIISANTAGTAFIVDVIEDCGDVAGKHTNWTAALGWHCGTSSTSGISGLTPGRFPNALSSTALQDGAIAEGVGSIAFLKPVEMCGGSTCYFNFDTTIFASTEKTWDFPVNASSTFVGHNTSQILTNKTINAPDNTVTNVGTANVAAILKTRLVQFILGADNGSALTDGDDQPSIFVNRYGQGVTVTEVWCESDAGTPTIMLVRDDGSPANILSGNLTCTTSGASTTSFSGSEASIADTNRIDFATVTAGGVAKRITVSIKMTLD